MTKKTTIRFVVHRGRLETQAIILATSLHFFNRDQFILEGCIPQNLKPEMAGISQSTRSILESLGVDFIEVNNPIDESYLIGNKFECLKGLSGPRIFLDTDIICCHELSIQKLQPEHIYVKPADRKTYSWQPRDWEKAHTCVYGRTHKPAKNVLSTCFNELMEPYYNAGFIALNGCENFSDIWQQAANKIDNNPELEHKRPWLDQLALPIAIEQAKLTVNHLSDSYNYPANIKPLNRPDIQLCHYHRPDVVARNPQLIHVLSELVTEYPFLMEVLKTDSDWQDVYQLIQNQTQQKATDLIITGIPRSGTSFLCSLLTSTNQMVIINEPTEVTKPLKRRQVPWGIATYYQSIKRDIKLKRPFLNKHNKGKITEDTYQNNSRTPFLADVGDQDYVLGTKNTLAYLSALSRMIQVMPEAHYIACFRNPVDTIASWRNSFEHLKTAKPYDIKVLKQNSQWLAEHEKQFLDLIQQDPDPLYRQAMLWNFLAQQIIKHQKILSVIAYEDLVTQPGQIYQSIFNKPAPINFINSEVKSKRDQLTEQQMRFIKNLTWQTYSELMSIRIQ